MGKNTKPDIAWVDDDTLTLELNLYCLSDGIHLFNFDFFRKNSGLYSKPPISEDDLNLVLARERLTKSYNYEGIILDDMIFDKGEAYPLDDIEKGEHLLQDIRSHKINKETPVIMYTQSDESEMIERCKQSGANFWVHKQCGPSGIFQEDLYQTVRSLNPTTNSLDFIETFLKLPRYSDYDPDFDSEEISRNKFSDLIESERLKISGLLSKCYHNFFA